MPKLFTVATLAEIPSQSAKCVEVEGKRIAIFNLGSECYALDDVCSHRGGPLSEGEIDGEEVQCPWHGARFNLRSGAVTAPPAQNGVTAYTVYATDDAIKIEV